MMRPLVLYHANCADGFCAAWVAYQKFGDKADYLPVQYEQEPPDVRDRDVFILDFSYKRSVLLEMREAAERMVLLDHHKTAQEELKGFPTCADVCIHFDMEKSGARLTSEYFFPGHPVPWLVDYTEDRDLWRWKLPESRAVSAALASLPRTFAEWDRLHDLSTPIDTLAQEGKAILRYQVQQIESICACAREVDLDGHKIIAANTSCLFSEVAGKLAEGRPFGAAWFVRSDGKKQWSLRSRDEGVDVAELARRHGGGGHRNAAGFEE